MVQLDGGRFATSHSTTSTAASSTRTTASSGCSTSARRRSSSTTRSGCSQEAVDALFERRARGQRRAGQPRPEVTERHAQGQAGPLPPEPAGQARGLLRPIGDRVRPVAAPAPGGLPKLMALELFKPFIMSRLVERKAVEHQGGQEDGRLDGPRGLGRARGGHPRAPRAARTARRRCTAWASRRSSRCWSRARRSRSPAGLSRVQRGLRRRPDGGPPPAQRRGAGGGRVLMLSSNNILSRRTGRRWRSRRRTWCSARTTSRSGRTRTSSRRWTARKSGPARVPDGAGGTARVRARHGRARHALAEFRAPGRKGGHVLTTVGRIIFNDRIERALEEAMGEEFDRESYASSTRRSRSATSRASWTS